MSSGGERNLDDDDDVVLSLAFSGRVLEKKLFLFVDVKDKLGQILIISCYRGSDE
jgi:hypothetical protein